MAYTFTRFANDNRVVDLLPTTSTAYETRDNVHLRGEFVLLVSFLLEVVCTIAVGVPRPAERTTVLPIVLIARTWTISYSASPALIDGAFFCRRVHNLKEEAFNVNLPGDLRFLPWKGRKLFVCHLTFLLREALRLRYRE